MKKGFLVPAVLTLILAAACTGGPAPGSPPEKPALPAEGEAERGGEYRGDRLEEAAFNGLPSEARGYLKTLSEAFRRAGRRFLLAQGEPQFESEVRPRFDEETYLALLYRIGPLGGESPEQGNLLPRLFPERVAGIEYSDWAEAGPFLEIRGRLILREGPPLPCRIMLVWRLPEPKILGLFP